jgi:hypothetical protein
MRVAAVLLSMVTFGIYLHDNSPVSLAWSAWWLAIASLFPKKREAG